MVLPRFADRGLVTFSLRWRWPRERSDMCREAGSEMFFLVGSQGGETDVENKTLLERASNKGDILPTFAQLSPMSLSLCACTHGEY